MAAYYNEIEPYAAQWLRNLIAAGHIAPGEVDERSIVDVDARDLRGFDQCHFFAGIAGWSLAARLAGWPDDRPLWTGSCPCQPFSIAGRRGGQRDARHLWPAFFRLIAACRPPVVMGEQVATPAGRAWLDGVFADLEGDGYACRAAIVPACAVNAPHRRDRLWFVGQTWCAPGRAPGFVGHARNTRLALGSGPPNQPRIVRDEGQAAAPASARNIWASAAWLVAFDGKARRFEPRIRLLADGLPARVGQLRAYGNAIVPQLGAEIIKAFLDCQP